MYEIIVLLYAILIIGMLLGSLFVVFHLASYSINRSTAKRTILVFIIGSVLLVFANISIFFSIPRSDFDSFAVPTIETSSSKF